ncbi:hypothetical protein N431DRAFT_430947 [Stipitochalara longipes BDJ]|nr:hypothetical protein N431DRAFT_430947 [Stipitochalara longipes BDJ]
MLHAPIISSSLEYLTWKGCQLRESLLHEEESPHNHQPKAKSEKLHGLSTDLHMLAETFYDQEELILFLINARNRISIVIEDPKSRDQLQSSDMLDHLLSKTRKAGRLVGDYRERIKTRINLSFHLSTQADNEINLQISNATKSIAHDAQRDSSSMITIAAVTMFFLPGTFISAFFSMTFFNFQEDNTGNQQFQVSDKWWYFVAATVPLTAVVFVVWIFWQKWRFGRANKDSKTVRVRLDDDI